MKKLSPRYTNVLVASMLSIIAYVPISGFAQQQKNAYAYIYWDFGQGADDV